MQTRTLILVYGFLVIPPLIVAVAAALIEDPGSRNRITVALLAVFVTAGAATFAYHALRGLRYEGRLRAGDGTELAVRVFGTRTDCESGMVELLKADRGAPASTSGSATERPAAANDPGYFECRWTIDW